ncbi:MAG: terminase gpA endonuclease subunit [Pseudomonadota bacterium]|nr:terminase gpA endonuclease subunit [Pseudomonadota bacterium]
MAIPAPRWKLPPPTTGADILRRQAHHVRPKLKTTVSRWAIANREYDPSTLPWQTEIMDALSDPEVAEVGMIKPSQCGGTEIGLAWLGWIIDTDPSDSLVCQPDQNMAGIFSKTRLRKLIDDTPSVKQKLKPTADADTVHLKLFQGMELAAVWPVPSQFTQRPVRYGWLDDYDQYDEDIGSSKDKGGQGSGIALLEGRNTSHEGREKKFVSSSPAREDGGGVEAFVAGGTDERLQPVCPSCGERWEVDILRDLHFDRSGTPDDAEASAYVVCGTGNGCHLLPTDRRAVLDSLTDLPNKGFVAANPAASKRRRSFRVDGLMALTSWPKLARIWREALISWELRQDESDLRNFHNTKGGKNYRSIASGEKPIATNDLRQRLTPGWKLGTVPRGPVVLNLIIDVQHDRFECGVVGYAKDGERWLIDRFAIDVLEDGLTQVSPFIHIEHWKVLLPLFDRKYPMVDGGGGTVGHAPILSLTVDTGGSDRKGDQATAGARWFWNAARALGVHPSRITLVKGGSNRDGRKLMPPGEFADQKIKGGAKRNSARLWLPNVHKIKNIIDARLRRKSPGPGYIHLPEDLSEEHLDEITAEELKKGKWEKLRARNETLDILVYGEAAILKPPFAQSRSDMRWVPKDFRIIWPADGVAVLPLPPANDRAVKKPEPAKTPAVASPREIAARPVARASPPTNKREWLPARRSDWLQRRR